MAVAICFAAFSMGRAETMKNNPSPSVPKLEKAVFAGGCFWCMQPPYDRLKGVVSTRVGYAGGTQKNPTYEQVSAGGTGHAEAIEVTFDPSLTNYGELLDVFWMNVDPTALNKQFCDEGDQYRTAIFYAGEEQKNLAEASKQKLETSGILKAPVVTEISALSVFYPAEEYHQKYYQKNPVRYKFYRFNCGRDQTLKRIWGAAPGH